MLSSVSEGGKNRRLRHAGNSRGFGNFRGNYTRGLSNCESFWKKMIGKSRLSGRKLNVRFDEGELEIGGISYYASSLLYPEAFF